MTDYVKYLDECIDEKWNGEECHHIMSCPLLLSSLVCLCPMVSGKTRAAVEVVVGMQWVDKWKASYQLQVCRRRMVDCVLDGMSEGLV
jgi:hypothetical protein